MADAVIRIGGNSHRVRLAGAQGPRGFNGPDLTELAGPDGSSEIGFSAGPGAETESLEAILRQQVRVTSWGASPAATGAANAAAFNAASAAAGIGGCVLVPFGTYAIDGTVAILAGQQWHLQGAVLQQTANVPTLLADEADYFQLFGGQIIGNRPGGDYTDSGQNGLKVVNTIGGVVNGLRCYNLRGAGFHQEGSQIPALTGVGNNYANCFSVFNALGRQVIAGSKSEFSHWSNWTSAGNGGGDDISAGNTTTDGGSVSSNVEFGVRITGGANDGHGGYQNVTIAHNGGYQIYAFKVRNGYDFDNCRLYDGSVAFIGCNGIHIRGGILSIATIYNRFDPDNPAIEGTNYILGAWCPGSSINVVREEVEHDPNLVIMKCTGPGSYDGGVSINSASPVSMRAGRNPGELQTLVAGDKLEWTEVLGNGDFRHCLNGDKDLFTAAEAGDYHMRMRAFCTVTDSTLGDSYLAIHVDGAATIDPALPTAMFGTTLMQFDVEWVGYLNAGETLDVRSQIDGTAPKFGHSGFRSWWTVDRKA